MFGRKTTKTTPTAAPEPPFVRESAQPFWFRRAVGFTIKARIGEPERCVIKRKRHGGERESTLDRALLRRWMAMDQFREWPAEPEVLRALEANDLVYYARSAGGRATSGAPLLTGPEANARIALRDGVGLTLAIGDGDEIVPWVFMPRRGALADKRLHGVRLSSLERGAEAYSLDLYGTDAEVRALRELLPLLDGTRTWRELQTTPVAGAILEWLDDSGLLDDAPPAPLEMPRDSLAWLGHACVLVQLGATRLLVDPLCIRRHLPPKPYQETPFDWRRLPRPDALLITHADNDHLNPSTLLRLPRELPVFIAAPVAPKPYQVDAAEVLRFLGFTRITELQPWQRVNVGDAAIVATPFEGEDWGLPLAKTTFALQGQRTVYLGADSHNSARALAEIRERVGPVDFACLGVSGCEEPLVAPPGFGYGEFYALWLPRDRRNEWLVHTDGPSHAAEAARALGAKRAFGYAAGGGSFMDMAHSDSGSHAALAELLDGSGSEAVALGLGEPHGL